MSTTRHLRIHGTVQGVGYRQWMQRTATRLGVEGWVRNRGDGTVEALVRGRPEAVAELLRACRRGPAGAAVTALDDRPGSDHAVADAPAGFSRRDTLP